MRNGFVAIVTIFLIIILLLIHLFYIRNEAQREGFVSMANVPRTIRDYAAPMLRNLRLTVTSLLTKICVAKKRLHRKIMK